MIPACLSLMGLGLALSLPLTWIAAGLGRRLGQMDQPGQRKIHLAPVPSTGGVAIFLCLTLPMAGVLAGAWAFPQRMAAWWPELGPHLEGIRTQTPMAVALILAMAGLHGVGLVDDRKRLGPWTKLVAQIAAALVVVLPGTRLLDLEVLRNALGPAPSILVTVVWIVAITNAFNFLDNMDGLAGGVATICAGIFMAAACLGGQWFIAGQLALLVGALLGFLVFNFPKARIFMGDGGSLVVGFLLAFCSVRLTYFGPGSTGHWWAVLTPLVVLAIPLYDLTSVVAIRLIQGRNPLVGDTQHFSHRLVRRGLSPTAAVLVIWSCTLATGLSGAILAYLPGWQAILVAVQCGAVLLVLALMERAGGFGEGRP